MKDVLYLETLDQAEALLKPMRVDVLRRLAEPRTCTELSGVLGHSPQKIYYHVRKLADAGLVDQVSSRQVRGITEGIYQASARAYWLSPRLIGTLAPRQPTGELGFGYLLNLVEQVQTELADLGADAVDLPSLAVSGEVQLSAADRAAFLTELRGTLEELFTRYGGPVDGDRDPFRIAIAVYPRPDERG
ncbi:winged helix-turn-helix domain-containing protein [Amycolatopsis nigrescens]|uniref:winged helix-turn-helix domain-containing protein n=1 Tax=Amycolatopsis nigrescens TaxID=381445 RepID=UPI0003667CDC|nr:helix-turn-helix domain-containing protein [Amycolatopsis nigrescens]